MKYFRNKNNLFFKTCSILLIFLHLFAFGPIRDAFAFNAQSASYKLTSASLNEGGKTRATTYTKLLSHFDGPNGATSATAETGQSLTFIGNARLDTSQKVFGSSALALDGNSYVSVPDSDDWNLGSGDFTLEGWFKKNDVNIVPFFEQCVDNNHYWAFYFWSVYMYFEQNTGSGLKQYAFNVSGLNWQPGVWYHVALVRSGNALKLFVNGVQQDNTVDLTGFSLADFVAPLKIGTQTPNSWFFNGSFDELRLSKGLARWTTNFTPPQAPYSNTPEDLGSTKLWQDTLAEPLSGKSQSQSYILNSGFISTIASNPPVLTQKIPYQTWAVNTAKNNAFTLEDYFVSPDGYPLTYSVLGNSKITVAIDTTTHQVSFSQAQDWFGLEKVYFVATDTEGNTFQSNQVTLQVAGPTGQLNKPVITDTQLNPSLIRAGDLTTLTVKAYSLDGKDLTFNYSDFFSETKHYKDGNYWYSQATWQTPAESQGHYAVTVTVSDGNLSDTSSVLVNVGNSNNPPVLDDLPDITAKEGDLVVITPHATDSDNDPLTFYYSSPFDSQGKWLTTYGNAGTYNIKVTASDGIDTVSKTAKVIINKTNRPPQVSLTLSKYTVRPNETFTITLSATDPDNDEMNFVLKKDNGTMEEGRWTMGESSKTFSTSFPDIANHTITATVTDSLGASTTDTKGVDVADPNANRDAINPVMGDFNGDSLTDLGLHNSDTGAWEVCLSDKGVFRNAVTWLTGFGTSRDWWPVGGDFNGDGKTDIGVYNNTTGELKIALSNGSSFTVSGTWLTFPSASYSWQPFTGNFNGDKYTDFGLYNKDTGEVQIALGTGSGFGPLATWLSPSSNNAGFIALAGDFNGDSLSDLCLFNKSTGEFKVYFSNTQAFVDGSTWVSGYASNQDALISDFNNDGLADIGYFDKSSSKWYYAISTGSKFVDKGIWLDNFGSSSDESATTGDFDGNGITDAACFDKDKLGIDRWTTKSSTTKPADLLTEIDNGIGGKTEVTYTYASQYANDALPFPVYVTSSVSLVNTVHSPQATDDSYTQNFSYAGGYFDATEREFRGFAKTTVTDPITGNYTETYFYQGKAGQDGSLKGQIDKIIAYDGNAKLISQSLNTYEVKKAGAGANSLGFPALTEQVTTVYEENASSLTTKNLLTYDNIGNVIETKNEGDLSKTGDEKIADITYSQAYEGFNRPIESLLKDTDGNIVTKKTAEYDDRGNLSRETFYIYNPLTKDEGRGTTNYSYDSFGNLTSTTDALGRTVSTEYDADFYAYPIKITNALGQSVTQTYNPKFGVVTSVTDTNGVTAQTFYDSLARVIRGTKDDGRGTMVTAVTYTYPDFNTKITTNALGLSKTESIDGLGRAYKTVSVGEDGAQARQVSTETYYNNRGQVESESLPHYIDEDPFQISYVRYEYDVRGRVKKTISDFPGTAKDAYSTINYINPLYVETTDPQGNKKGTLKDVYGNNIEITEFTQGGIYKTKYEYDIQNNLTKLTDSKGNITQIFYDSAGRKLKMLDPDMGTWLYEYDILGNLTKQTDAKNQVITFNYDELNRLTKKTKDDGRGTIDEVNYIYDDAAKENCIGRLSKVIDTSGSTEFFYDKLGREVKSIKTVSGNTYQVLRAYDILDRLTALTYPDNTVINYSYDPNSGLLKKVFSSSPLALPSSIFVSNINYNAKGQLRDITYGNNVKTTYTYGQDLRLSNILTLAPTSTLQNLNYIFDKNGNITTLTDNLRSNIRNYTYDELNRLTQANNVPAPGGGYTNFNYQYDSIGNMTYKSDVGVMTYGQNAGPHAVTSAGGYNYQYDANGNMLVGKNKTLTYDVENRLTSVTGLLSTETYTYDGDGGRVRKAMNDGRGTIETTTYIGSLYETQTTNNETRIIKHIFAGSTRVCTITKDEGGGTTDVSYYHPDHLGSSNIITDQDGYLAQRYEYTPYGTTAVSEIVPHPSSLIPRNPVHHKFTGKELDSTGLYFYGARYYDPEIGRFITPDTLVQDPFNPQTLNRYTYCNNNPINYVDPSGHFWWIAAILAIISVVTTVAGVISSATGNVSLAKTFFQISQYSGYASAAIAAVNFVGAAIQAAKPQAINISSLITNLTGESKVDLGVLVVTPDKSMVVSTAWDATKGTTVSGIIGAISGLGTQAVNFVIDIPTISGGIALIKGADYSTIRGWVEAGVGAIGTVAATADAGLNVVSFGAKGMIEQGAKNVVKRIVIGEGSERVAEKALAVGAEHYIPRIPLPKNPTAANISRVMKSNYQWLKSKIEQGYEIIDIGLDPNRAGGRGIFYEAEKRWLALWGKP